MNHHGEALRRLVKDPAGVRQLAKSWQQAELTKEEKSMLGFSVKLALSPESVSHADHLMLRQNGFTERAILDMTQIIAYFSFVNRMALGLGVELEQYWSLGNDRLLD